jgi:hypothetical protein
MQYSSSGLTSAKEKLIQAACLHMSQNISSKTNWEKMYLNFKKS